jgi:hypothetical protein
MFDRLLKWILKVMPTFLSGALLLFFFARRYSYSFCHDTEELPGEGMRGGQQPPTVFN